MLCAKSLEYCIKILSEDMGKIVAIFILHLIIKQGFCSPSPCPHIFQFGSERDKNYGIITIPPSETGLNILKVKLGLHNPTGGTNSLDLVKPIDEAKADAKRGMNIQFKLNFLQSSQLPNIIRIALNDRDICSGIEIPNTLVFELQYAFAAPSFPSTPTSPSSKPLSSDTRVVQPDDASWLKSLSFAGTCGKTLQPTQLIIGGVGISPGEYPWMVAMYHYKPGSSMEFKCGASLISNKYVITAAHCTRNQKQVHLEFGKNNIDNQYETHYTSRTSSKIITHPEYMDSAHGDIALVSFHPPITFTQWIVPICLWANFDSKLRQGVVAGWGQLDNYGSQSIFPMQLNVSMVDLQVCRDSHISLQKITTFKTFCAGGKNSGPCKGDSGGGFFVVHQNVWYLRGIISHSLGTTWTCNVNEYSVYADLAYSLDWIRSYLTADPVGVSIAKRKCEEYRQLRANIDETLQGHIVTDVAQYPHIALLGYGNPTEWLCGGTLISDQFILTAAHCLNRLESQVPVSTAHLGFLDKRNRNESGTLQEFRIIQTYMHPTRKSPKLYADIALLKLDRPVKYTKGVMPACLHEDFNFQTDKTQEIGWNRHGTNEDSNLLKVANLTLSSDADCTRYYSASRRFPQGIDAESQFCAGNKEQQLNNCEDQIQSGGPLQIYDHTGMPKIIGIQSFGKYCYFVEVTPYVYTRVSHYVRWIEDIVWP